MWQLQNLDIEDFLANYWQKKPLLIRQAIPGFRSILSPEELAGLACEQGVHSRLVIEKGADKPWQLSYGPFKERDFTSLPMTHYSLLVSECEKWLPELRQLIELFDFIPRWRIDDLMISYAPEHGSVGPHIDEYDVFLLQANGQRRWSIQHQQIEKPELIADIDLAIMRHFDADEEWILDPGDILYLPPRIAHHGVAVGDGCMTYSVGFRAPALNDIMDSFMLEASEHHLSESRYQDPPLSPRQYSSEIFDQDIEQFRSLVEKMMQQSSPLWPDIVGKLVSDCTLADDIHSIQCDSLQTAADYDWQKHPDSRIFFYRDSQQCRLYVNGQVEYLSLSPANLDFCLLLCQQQQFRFDQLTHDLSTEAEAVLLKLINNHALIPDNGDE